jgi:selenophosphate synthase
MSEGGVIEFIGDGPCKSRYQGAMKIIPDGAAGNVTAYGNLADREVMPPLEP